MLGCPSLDFHVEMGLLDPQSIKQVDSCLQGTKTACCCPAQRQTKVRDPASSVCLSLVRECIDAILSSRLPGLAVIEAIRSALLFLGCVFKLIVERPT